MVFGREEAWYPGYDSTSFAAVSGAVLVYLAVVVIAYVWTSLALGRVFAKLGGPSAAAWVPVANLVTLFRLGGVSAAFVALLLIPVANVVGIVMMLTAVHRINLRFGVGAGMTVLALLLFPVWASVLGFGATTPAKAASGVARPAAPPPLPPVVTVPAWNPPPAAPPAATVQPVAVVQLPLVLPPVAQSVAPIVSEPPTARPADPWAPPSAASVRVPPISRAPAEQPPDLENTVVSRRPTRETWFLTPENGEPVRLTAASVLLGRNPSPREGLADAQLVILPDPSRTVSKTHAHLARANGGWSITDLSSTNGVYLLSPADEETELDPGVVTDAGAAFRLGDLTVRLTMGTPS